MMGTEASEEWVQACVGQRDTQVQGQTNVPEGRLLRKGTGKWSQRLASGTCRVKKALGPDDLAESFQSCRSRSGLSVRRPAYGPGDWKERHKEGEIHRQL